MNRELFREFIFWGIWLIIPLCIDIVGGIIGCILVVKSHFMKHPMEMDYLPNVTIMIPVYNSAKTLESCLTSISKQDYPLKNILILLLNNGAKDDSYEIFCRFQEKNANLRMWWVDSSNGKSKALNKGLYMADGKYIINIDSDGALDKSAIRNIVEKFEENQDIYAMTGVVLIDHKQIEENKDLNMRLLQRCEAFEYGEAFLVGRGFQSYSNTMFTLSGAFSCFRKDIVYKTQLYNSETLGEDTHMTSQIRNLLKGKICLCENAFFYVDPIESVDKLYIQRQRWQRGEIEVASLFKDTVDRKQKGIFNVLKYNMLKDHTLVFPRFIWLFAMVYLIFFDYPLKLIIGANIIMYFAYVFNSLLYFLASKLFLKEQSEASAYMNTHWYIVCLLPLYRLMVFFMRLAGTINAAERYAAWNAKTFSQEKEDIKHILNKKFSFYYKVKAWVNSDV